MLMLRVLVVEDDPAILQLYSIVLGKEGYQVFSAQNGEEAWEILDREHIDLVITDIMMPVMDGYEFVRLLRESDALLPILMITAREDFASKNAGFTVGADDYMVKPIDPEEMLLRVKALLRRANIMSSRQLHILQTLLDYDALTVTRGTESLMLPPKEFYLLYKLLSYPDKIFTRMQLMDEIWGRDSASDTQTVDVHINRLRRRFEKNPDFQIVTVRGLGYKAEVRLG